MNYELSGTIKIINDTQSFASGFSKRELIVTVPDGNYPQDISLEFLNDKVDLLNDFQVGDEVTVAFNLRGREYNGKYYNNLIAWKIQRQAQDYPSNDSGQTNFDSAPKLQEPDFSDFDSDEPPFWNLRSC